MQQHVYSIALTCRLLGVEQVIICPGSRSAPLVFAFSSIREFTITSVLDERSAGYMALGMAQQTRKPVVLICTSGTAAINFYPAIAEAYYQQIPLLVLTADRPSELLNQQDGQMINQQNLYGSHVKASFNLPNFAHQDEQHKQTVSIIAAALSAASGEHCGPVHVNVPLSEPLYPTHIPKQFSQLEKSILTWLHKHSRNAEVVNSPGVQSVTRAWIRAKKKLVIIGQALLREAWITPLLKLAVENDVVILTDLTSNQLAACSVPNFDKLIAASDVRQLQQLQPDFILSFGGAVLSKSLKNWLKQIKPETHIRVDKHDYLIDTYGNVTHHIQLPVEDVLNGLAELKWNSPPEPVYRNCWLSASAKLDAKLKPYLCKPIWSELHAIAHLISKLPIGANLQLANSSAIRYVSWSGTSRTDVLINGNRGTSGIDGCTSTALGAAMVNRRTTVLVTGDLAFLYDRNALQLNKIPTNLKIVVINNQGGGIFTLIDGPTKHKAFAQYFTTPHRVNIKNIALENHLDYYFCQSINGLDKVLDAFFNPLSKAAILELKFDMKINAALFKKFKQLKIK